MGELVLLCSRSYTAHTVALLPLLTAMQAGNNVLVGLPSSELLRSGGLPLLLEELKEGTAQMDTWAALTVLVIAAALSCV